MVVRLGQLSSAFGSFLLRYDDADNPLIGMPQAYGYYYKPVSTLGLTGVESVRIGKRVEIEFAGDADLDRAREIADKLLANPVIEDFTLHVEDGRA